MQAMHTNLIHVLYERSFDFITETIELKQSVSKSMLKHRMTRFFDRGVEYRDGSQ